MPPLETLRDAAQSIRANALRSLLTMLGIVIGTASVIAMLSVGAGAQARIAEQVRSLGVNLLMAVPETRQPTVGPRLPPRPLTRADAAAMAALPGVAMTAPALQGEGLLVNGSRNRHARINGTSAVYFAIRDWPLAAGRVFSAREEAGAGKVAVLGATVAEALFGDDEPVGREVRVLSTPMTVIGVLASKGLSGTGRDQDDIVFVPFATAETRLGAATPGVTPDTVSYIMAKAISGDRLKATAAAIADLLYQRHRIAPGEPPGFRVTDPAAAIEAERGSARAVGWLLGAIASISLVVGGIGIMNIMLVSVSDATREIGLRLALGARRRDITRLFLAEAMLLCLIGGVIGAALGVATAGAVARLAGWPMLVLPETVLASLAFSAMVGLIFGAYPARKAASLAPAVALRIE